MKFQQIVHNFNSAARESVKRENVARNLERVGNPDIVEKVRFNGLLRPVTSCVFRQQRNFYSRASCKYCLTTYRKEYAVYCNSFYILH
jgi:hypothetical protein